jgi:hypothetical protein
MAHYAFIDSTMTVTEVIVGVDEWETVNGITGTEGWEAFYASQRPGMICKRTSYNGNIRGVYAGIGYTYHPDVDEFRPPPCHPDCLWDGGWQCTEIPDDL